MMIDLGKLGLNRVSSFVKALICYQCLMGFWFTGV